MLSKEKIAAVDIIDSMLKTNMSAAPFSDFCGSFDIRMFQGEAEKVGGLAAFCCHGLLASR